ncbi:TP53-binding protein 1 [Trichonephila clavata]|uniref:TP53-binding protein 1 n=1 Tax=Trichonephila clavata TaxID=2740835 RepID=A0A8X6HMV3_TRICU|nr:TP53-binding protein 1 [Trichonephila clavata]
MDKGNDKKSLHPGSFDSTDQGNSQGFSPRAGAEPEPVRVLQLSESFFAADTVDDDESIIPPTQEMLIPNTPPPAEASDKEGNVSNGNNDTTLSNLEETCIGDIEKDIKQMEAEKDDEELMEIGSQNDMTQDIPGLEETQPVLGSGTAEYLPREVMDDDEWQLRFSESQETQELLDPLKMRDLKEQEHLSAIAEEKEEESVRKGASPEKQTDAQKIESEKSHDNSDDKFEDEDSENEIEPSQSCLDDNTYSAFRDQLTQIAQENQKAYSTPDPECILKDGQKTGSQDAKALLMPSPIVKKVEAPQSSRLTEQTESELEQTADILTSESQQPSSPLLTGILEANEPILVLDTEPQQLKHSPVAEASKDETMVVCDTIELVSSTDDTGVECLNQEDAPELVSKTQESIENETKKESEDSGTNGKELGIDEIVIVTAKEDIKVSEAKGSSTEEYNIGSISSGENCLEDKKEVITVPDTLPDTLPTTMLPPLSTSRLSRRQKFETIKKNPQQGSNYEKSEKTPRSAIGTFKDTKSLENIFNSAFGIFLDHECLEAMLSLKPNEELKVKKVFDFSVKNNTVFLEQSIEIGSPNYHQRHLAISPHSGSSSATTNSTATTKSLHSGEIADISSSSSAKSANSSGMHFDSTAHSTLSSQEHAVKTSTQNSEQPSSFGNIFTPKKKDDSFEMEKTDAALPNISISPIKKKETQAAASRKRGGRKAAQINNKAAPVAKRKRGRNAKVTVEDVVEEISTADDVENRPKKLRKKRNEKEPPPKPSLRDSPVVQEIVASDSSDDPYKDSPFGRMLPGVRVMARWKDGYYYPGIVQKQESEGRWSVKFDDEDVKAIPQENLIKVYNLEKGTSVLAMSPDDFYDPGIVCGHYTDATGSGYEVELDNGVTKRYPRSAVILSNDQAKLLTSTRPPTTPATMTINLDNIIDGKRKRKSVQTPEPSPVLKKSPRRISSRISKIDPNLDSTEESAHTDKEPFSVKRQVETTETEEDTLPQRSTRKRKAAKTGAMKITHALTQSAGRHPKLLKDYAFLLTNAERKPALKVNTSDSETVNEEEEIMPFDKDELVDYILSRGGTILDKFDDVQDCKKKNIFLLANTYLRTMKYIKCIAAGILCIKHHWVQNCCFKGEILNHVSYILPAGKSLINNEIVEWHGRSDVLKGLKISLISGPDNPFVPTWTPVLLAAKADFVLKWNLPSSKSGGCFMHVDVLVTNSHCPPDVLQSARRRKIPIVSSEWIIQSLIAGKCLPYDDHPKFKHDYVE